MKVGDVVPDFELPDETGTPRRLSELLSGSSVVLFFYPAAMTRGCTAESCHFRDLVGEFAAVGARVVGISHDPVDRQRMFSDRHEFGFPLLSDPKGDVARLFGVRRRLPVLPVQRATFVIGPDFQVRAVIRSELNMELHADRALALLREAA